MNDQMSVQDKINPTVQSLSRVLDDNRVQFLAFDLREDRKFIEFFRIKSKWQVDFEDNTAVLFVRKSF